MEKCPYKTRDEIIARDKKILEAMNGGSKKVKSVS
jgi:hypothetical protein